MQALRPVLRRLATREGFQRKYHGSNHKLTTFNDLPVPSGSWQAQYDANQRKYNLHLLLGISFTVFSIITAKTSGLIYLNWSHPDRPEE